MDPSVKNHVAGACALLLSALLLAGCHARENTEVEVEVRSVGIDDASHAPVVLLQDRDRKIALPIWIGPTEAEAIVMQMEGISPPRPMTHDLMKTMLERAGVEFQKVVIEDLKGSTYYAHIYLHAGRNDLEIDSRPSDAIALAVRFHRPIFVRTGLMKGDGAIDLQREARGASTIRYSGVTVQNLTDDVAEYFSLPPGKGVIVAEVEHGAPAGLERGDVILEVDGTTVTGIGDFAAKMDALKPDMPVRLSVQRGTQRVPVQFATHAQR